MFCFGVHIKLHSLPYFVVELLLGRRELVFLVVGIHFIRGVHVRERFFDMLLLYHLQLEASTSSLS